MSCEFERIKGTGIDGPEEFRCATSKDTDVEDCLGCCFACGCSCETEEEEDCEDCGEPVPEGCFGGCAR